MTEPDFIMKFDEETNELNSWFFTNGDLTPRKRQMTYTNIKSTTKKRKLVKRNPSSNDKENMRKFVQRPKSPIRTGSNEFKLSTSSSYLNLTSNLNINKNKLNNVLKEKSDKSVLDVSFTLC
jgi:beta-N-acetylglucosaminidase